MRIAVVSPIWERVPPPAYGGIEAVVSLLVDGLVHRGHEVTLYATGDKETDNSLDSAVSWRRYALPDRAHDSDAHCSLSRSAPEAINPSPRHDFTFIGYRANPFYDPRVVLGRHARILSPDRPGKRHYTIVHEHEDL